MPSLERARQYAEYRAEVSGERMVGSLRSGIAIVAVLTTCFIALDYAAFRESFAPLLVARLALDVALAAFWWRASRQPERSMLGATLATGFGLVAVIGVAGGVTSPYYPGIMLLFLGMPVLLPLTAPQSAGIVGVLFVSFASLPLFASEPVALRDYLTSLFFPGAAALECVASCALLDRLRFQDHLRQQEIIAARDELAKLDDAKTRFTANVHHELRTPLTLMLAPLEGLRSGDYGAVPEAVAKTLHTMHANGRRLLKLINNLLDLAKLENQQFEITRAPIDLSDWIESLVEGARPMAERKGLTLRTEGLAGLPSLFADAEALDKVLVNLVGNALKFTEEGGSITVSARAVEGGIEIEVRDTGVGLEAAQLERIFDRFAQVDGSATRAHEGTGIGLSLAMELTQLHGGRLWATSEGLGHGTAMHVFLPLGQADTRVEPVLRDDMGQGVALSTSIAAVEAELSFEPEAGGEDERGREDERLVELDHSVHRWQDRSPLDGSAQDATDDRPSVLVADDNADMRDLLGFILGREFRVRVVKNGREALESLEEFTPELIVTDVMMPEMSGIELCEAVKSSERFADLPVMIVSSKAESEMKIAGLELGADDYVTKPFHPRELLVRARALASLRRAQRELAERNEELEKALFQLRLAQGQIVQSERLAAVGELAAGLAHEVNNPVNYALNAVRALSATTEELREIAGAAAALDWQDIAKLQTQGEALRARIEEAGAEDLAATLGELASIVADGLERTHRLVADLRDFAAPGQGGRKIPVDLRAGVRATAQLLRHELEKAEIDLALALPDRLPSVTGDPGALNQVFLNLLKNAADAVQEGGEPRIEVEAWESNGEQYVAVRDQGPGITNEVQARLFEPFFTTKEPGRGTGLGLSMCRRIAEDHGGRIEVETALGSGSCFTLVVPAMPPRPDEPNA